MEKYFNLRGKETTRLDTFIDAAFAFATTMLVISIGNIPNNINELLLAFKGIPSFAASFLSVIFIWMGHRKWSRRYGIENAFTISLSFTLVFVLMIYVYPLRLVFSAFFSWVSGGFFPSEFIIESGAELPKLFIFYGIGFGTITICMTLLFHYAYKKRKSLNMSKIELIITKYEISSWLTLSATGLSSAIFALVMPLRIAVYAGFIYTTLPVVMTAISMYYEKKIKVVLNNNLGEI